MPQPLPPKPGQKPTPLPPDTSMFKGRPSLKTESLRYAPRAIPNRPGASYSPQEMNVLKERVKKDYGTDIINNPDKIKMILDKERIRVSQGRGDSEKIKRQGEYQWLEQQLKGKK